MCIGQTKSLISGMSFSSIPSLIRVSLSLSNMSRKVSRFPLSEAAFPYNSAAYHAGQARGSDHVPR